MTIIGTLLTLVGAIGVWFYGYRYFHLRKLDRKLNKVLKEESEIYWRAIHFASDA